MNWEMAGVILVGITMITGGAYWAGEVRTKLENMCEHLKSILKVHQHHETRFQSHENKLDNHEDRISDLEDQK